MKAATVNEIKQELSNSSPSQLTELCLRLARFKKENKELLTYLLFEAHDTAAYIESVKQEMASQFEGMNKSNVYFVKKTLRKILRITNKFIRYSGNAAVETELLIYFCTTVKQMGAAINNNPVIANIFNNQLKKIYKAVNSMHEDLQYDYLKDIQQLQK